MCISNQLLFYCISNLTVDLSLLFVFNLRIAQLVGPCKRVGRLDSCIANEFETRVAEHSTHDNYDGLLRI